MEHFGIIDALEAKAAENGWKYYFGINDEYINSVTEGDDALGQLTLVYLFKATPTWSGARVSRIIYSGRIMLGRKFDPDGQGADLDEDSQQKYDRRLKELTSTLDNFLLNFKCEEGLELVSHSGYEYMINTFDENIDFVAVNNISFRQE